MELEAFRESRGPKDSLGMAKLFEEHLPEQMRLVLQPPKCERSLALKNRLERKNCDRYIIRQAGLLRFGRAYRQEIVFRITHQTGPAIVLLLRVPGKLVLAACRR